MLHTISNNLLINTPLERGARGNFGMVNRFNGFPGLAETVETVPGPKLSPATPLKRGVNESDCVRNGGIPC